MRIVHLVIAQMLAATAAAQTVIPALDEKETPGPRPYEMVWSGRTEDAAPTLRFDQLAGWKMDARGGAEASLQPTHAQNLWDRPVARLRYRGAGKVPEKPALSIYPPSPARLPPNADSIDLWIFGNRWDWENPPDTPPVRIVLNLRAADNTTRNIGLGNIRWKEWWLMHARIPGALAEPVELQSITVEGGAQPEWREIFFDSLRFYKEELLPLKFEKRPRRNLTLFEGQSPGANTGPGKLPFPVREQTILPLQLAGKFKTSVREERGEFVFEYKGDDGLISYRFSPAGGLAGVAGLIKGATVTLLQGAKVRLGAAESTPSLKSARIRQGVVTAEYLDGTTVRARIWQKSLVLDVINPSGQAAELSLGEIAGVREPRAIAVPFLNYGGGPHPCVLLSGRDSEAFFGSIWVDWYRSNGSELYALESTSTNTARINGGVRYVPRTDGKRNPMFERVFITLSPMFEEVLPVVPNPAGLNASAAVDRLWQESWGPQNYEKEMKRSEVLRAYGIEKLIQCNHEISWRDGGESFTLRHRAAPGKGGDEALEKYVAHQRGLGWFAGLYSNYTDYAPVNEFWSPDGVQRQSDGAWRSAWPRCYAGKPLKAVEFDALLAPRIKAKFKSNSAYTDVHTAVSPWGYNDYDSRVPGAGTFAQTFYAYGELLRNDSRVYGGPIFSEGTYHWLYAGLADGNYALAYDGRPLAKEPLLPVFDLLQIHPKECDIGMGWTGNFCEAIPNWSQPGNIDAAIDRFLLNTLAYGHIGWLVEESHGISRTCRSYYMLQQVQARYGLQRPVRIAYWDGRKLVSVSDALIRDLPRTRRQMFIEYPSGLMLWLNDHPTENWQIETLDFRELGNRVLPPGGWAAAAKDGSLVSYSALNGTNRVDYLRSQAYVYLDGRGSLFSTREASTDGALVLRRRGLSEWEALHISGEKAFSIRHPFARGSCEAFDVDGKPLAAPKRTERDGEILIEPDAKALKYVLKFAP